MFRVGIHNLAILGNQEGGELIVWILLGFVLLLCTLFQLNLWSLLMSTLFSLRGLQAHPQNPHSWRTSLSLLVWLLSLSLSLSLCNTRREIQIQTKLDQPSRKNGQHQTSETRPKLQTYRKKRSWTPQETIATRRCRNNSSDLIHGGRWWWWIV